MAAEHDKKIFWKRMLFKHFLRPIWGHGIHFDVIFVIGWLIIAQTAQ